MGHGQVKVDDAAVTIESTVRCSDLIKMDMLGKVGGEGRSHGGDGEGVEACAAAI